MSARYQIKQNAIAIGQFKRAIERAREEGRLQKVIAAGKAMLEQLAADPYLLGESRGFFPIIRTFKRVAIFTPLTVYFFVDDALRYVTIVGIVLQEERKK